MTYYKKLVGNKCYLSPICEESAQNWTKWDNDLEVAVPLGDEAYNNYPLQKIKEIIGNCIEKQDHIFDIIMTDNDEHIGRCLLFEVNHINRRATLGIVIGEKQYWNNGYGHEATNLLLDYGFNLLNLQNIMLGVLSFNQRAISCYRKVGFKEIGRRRKARLINGRWYDLVYMDMLNEEFESIYVKHCLSIGRDQ
ncbi:MAG: GNAT family N-acetyltransferase [Candidatus Zixiibacteriota bacterium]|nr:MAG: GNAT family N-acetyltransferase [candidate division Zixibacteria bacterium]